VNIFNLVIIGTHSGGPLGGGHGGGPLGGGPLGHVLLNSSGRRGGGPLEFST
jgi:hypothetical protein